MHDRQRRKQLLRGQVPQVELGDPLLANRARDLGPVRLEEVPALRGLPRLWHGRQNPADISVDGLVGDLNGCGLQHVRPPYVLEALYPLLVLRGLLSG